MGRNNFTERQAKSRIEGTGYSNASELHKDDQGVWRGKADKAGTKTDVSLDFEGDANPPECAVTRLEGAGVPHSDIVANNSDNWDEAVRQVRS